MNKDCSYYEMYLKVILHEIKSPLASDTSFIEERARAAEEEIERQRLAGLSPIAAEEVGMHLLVSGIMDDRP